MSILDKIRGKAKQTTGQVVDDPSLRREGRQEERMGETKDELSRAQERAEAKAGEVADLERKTS
ncbi:MAG: CsbD family protein [Actinobacteria bacterium]|nr:MAG: CsbD family protein [Actinomycetota bacterium]